MICSHLIFISKLKSTICTLKKNNDNWFAEIQSWWKI